MTDILIGIGGTGAKIVEAATVLLAAGLGPRKLFVGLIDQDQSNGNVARTEELISDYRTFRARWSGSAPAAKLDWNSGADPHFDFCRTELEPLFGDRTTWCPGGDQTTIANMIGQNLNGPLQDLFDLLFMEGEEEQDLQLGEGYRGRAHVGAAALISRLIDPANQLTAAMAEHMAGGGSKEKVRIFIAGSAFGGTGAAGFPTVARELHRIRTSQEFANKGNVTIGGVLMLPYFGFAPPGEEDKNKVVTTDELLPKAQLALEHYGNLFQTEPAFDRFYLVGWDDFFQLNYHEAGNAEQCNPPLLPELIAASAAMNFLGGADAVNGAGSTTDERVRVCARDAPSLVWSDFPLTDIREKLGQLLRFAVYWRYTVRALIDVKRPWIGKGNWTHQLSEKAKLEDARDALQSLNGLLGDILVFAAATEKMAGTQWGTGLWQLGALHDHSEASTATKQIHLRESVDDPSELFNNAVRTSEGQRLQRDAAMVYDALENWNSDDIAGGGYGRVLAAAYRATQLS